MAPSSPNAAPILRDAARAMRGRGVTSEDASVAAVEGQAPAIEGIRLESGARIEIEALFIPVSTKETPLAAMPGCEFDETPHGKTIRTDAMKQTTRPGVYAAGDSARAMHSIAFAAADGMMAGVALHRDLIGL